MGAVYKRKKRCCGLCKPHKRGVSPRRKPKDEERRARDVREMRRATRR